MIESTDAKGLKVTYKYDPRDRRFEVTDRLGGKTTTHYDQNSNVTLILDADNALAAPITSQRATLYTYDERNLKTACQMPDHTPGSAVGDAEYGETSYVYDALSRTILMTDQQGDTQTHDYDLASRLLRKDYRTAANSPEGDNIADSDVFTYDNASRRITATSERYNNVCSMEYDDASRVISESLKVNVDQANETIFVTRNEYDEANRLIKQTYPDLSVVDRRYTVRNQLKEIDWNGTANIHTRTYDDGMRLKTTTHGNDVVSTLNYRGDESPEGEQPKDNQLSQISTSTGPNGVGNYNYDYDPNKNKSFENITGPLAGFGFGGTGSNGSATVYDADDRLTTWGRSDGALDRDWDLSLVGRWNSLTEND